MKGKVLSPNTKPNAQLSKQLQSTPNPKKQLGKSLTSLTWAAIAPEARQRERPPAA